jgi:tetratricopeptide (TPR) repeat protein
VLYVGIVRLSDKLHNQGLERLKNGDFFHGIQALTKSIAINKNNVPSRNLLGLALFEVGHVGEALKHWIISQMMLEDDNPAAKYIESLHKNARQLERSNDALEMYNQALGHIKQKSDDLAIIQLKKALEINPRFVDALNLLTLCYLIQNDRERALSAAERVLAIDTVNPIAMNYYSIVNPGKSRLPRTPSFKTKSLEPVGRTPFKSIGTEEKKPRNFHVAELLTFIIGVACALAACYFLLIPALHAERDREREESALALMEAKAEHQKELNEAEDIKNGLLSDILRLQNDELELTEQLYFEQRINTVNHAHSLYMEDILRPAVDLLEGIDTTNLPHNILQRIDEILEGSYPRLGAEHYNEGLAAFNAPRDSHKAVIQLEYAHRFLNDNAVQWNRLLFMLGTLYYSDEVDRKDDAYIILSELRERAPGLPNFSGTERTSFNNMLSDLEARR